MLLLKKLVAGSLALAFTLGALTALPAAAASVSIQVNGQGVTFDQPPIERAGRVFVPLRGVFERLGASVVYANGTINAQGNGRNVSLQIGSRQAIVNGQTQYIDVAPFLVGARTLVPLRFVAQALGAVVNYNGSNRTVYINGNGYSGGNVNTNTPAPNASFYLRNKQPATTSGTLLPLIAAEFSEPVNRDSLRIYIDGNDVTGQAYSSGSGFRVTPSGALSPGTHRVRVTGTTQAGASFNTSWTFNAENGGTINYIRYVNPAGGSRVGSNFTLRGVTRPNSHVHIVAQGSASVFGGIFQVGTGTFQTDVTADGAGDFAAPISINASGGGHVRVIVTSTAPNNSTINKVYDYNT